MADDLTPDLTPKKWRPAFLGALAEYGNVSKAAKRAKVSRQVVYDDRASDSSFAAAWDVALKRGTEALEDEARRRAFEGTLKPVFQGGKRVGSVREFSDTLLIFLLKAHKPDLYRETTRNINVNITPEQAASYSPEELEAELKRRGLL